MVLRSIRSIVLICMGFNLIVTILYAVNVLLNIISPLRVEKFQRISETGAEEIIFQYITSLVNNTKAFYILIAK